MEKKLNKTDVKGKMEKDSIFLLNSQSIKFKAVHNATSITNSSNNVIYNLKGISLIAVSASVEPLIIKENFIRKADEKDLDIENKLYEGLYYLNIVDYTLGEIAHAANHHCQLWCDGILKLFFEDPTKDEITITLKDESIKEFLLEANPNYFQTITQIDDFCKNYQITIQNLVQSASFSQLELQLAKVAARLSSEIFFFRRKLFTELFIRKVDQALYNYEKNDTNRWLAQNKIIYQKWKKIQLEKVEFYQQYTHSPYIFDDSEQFINFSSPKKFNPKEYLPQELISETFYWIDNFPKVKDRFNRAVELYKTNGDNIDCLNNLRLSLELLVKGILKNNKSLEKQLSAISQYQEQLGIGVEIRNTFVKTIDHFNKYQNNRVKHDVNIKSEHEVEFIFCLTMMFIRMLIKPNQEFYPDVL